MIPEKMLAFLCLDRITNYYNGYSDEEYKLMCEKRDKLVNEFIDEYSNEQVTTSRED